MSTIIIKLEKPETFQSVLHVTFILCYNMLSDFLLFSLKFSPAVEAVVKDTKRNPKRTQRKVKYQMPEIDINVKNWKWKICFQIKMITEFNHEKGKEF